MKVQHVAFGLNERYIQLSMYCFCPYGCSTKPGIDRVSWGSLDIQILLHVSFKELFV